MSPSKQHDIYKGSVEYICVVVFKYTDLVYFY